MAKPRDFKIGEMYCHSPPMVQPGTAWVMTLLEKTETVARYKWLDEAEHHDLPLKYWDADDSEYVLATPEQIAAAIAVRMGV